MHPNCAANYDILVRVSFSLSVVEYHERISLRLTLFQPAPVSGSCRNLTRSFLARLPEHTRYGFDICGTATSCRAKKEGNASRARTQACLSTTYRLNAWEPMTQTRLPPACRVRQPGVSPIAPPKPRRTPRRRAAAWPAVLAPCSTFFLFFFTGAESRRDRVNAI